MEPQATDPVKTAFNNHSESALGGPVLTFEAFKKALADLGAPCTGPGGPRAPSEEPPPRFIRNESTPKGRAFWAIVDAAAAKAPAGQEARVAESRKRSATQAGPA